MQQNILKFSAFDYFSHCVIALRIASREKQNEKQNPHIESQLATGKQQRDILTLSPCLYLSHTHIKTILIFPARLLTIFFTSSYLLFLPSNSNNDSFNVSILAVTDSTARHSLHLYFMFPVFISPFSNFSCCHNWQPKQRTRSGKTLFENEKKSNPWLLHLTLWVLATYPAVSLSLSVSLIFLSLFVTLPRNDTFSTTKTMTDFLVLVEFFLAFKRYKCQIVFVAHTVWIQSVMQV